MTSSTRSKKTSRRTETEEARTKRYRADPVAFVREVIRPEHIEPEQLEILQALAEHKRIAVKAGHGVGKTAALAWAILWFLSTRKDARVPCTAPTGHQLQDVLWAEVAKWMQRSPFFVRFFEWTKSKIQMRGREQTHFAAAISTSKPENMAGWHADHLLFVLDEAPGIPEEMHDPIEGALTGEDNIKIMIGNPTKTSGTFYQAFNRDRSQYKTLTFNAENSALVSKAYIEKMARYGKDSDIYKVRVLGEFPSAEPNSLIPLWMVEQAMGREIPDEGLAFIGVDPARFGNDESVLIWRRGDRVHSPIGFRGMDTQRQAGEVIRLAREIRAKGYVGRIQVRVDDTGIGGGVTDALRQQAEKHNLEIIAINFGGSARTEDFENYGAEMWGNLRERLKEISLPQDDDLIAQITSRKYAIDTNGKIKLEKKDDMKKRGLPSPDRADALVLCLADVRSDPFASTAGAFLTGERPAADDLSTATSFDGFGISSGGGRLAD